MIRLITQCQMEKEPVMRDSWVFLNHGADRLRSAQDVHVQVLDFLLADFTGVDDDAEACRAALRQRDFMGFGEHLPKEGRIFGADGGQRSDVFSR